MLCDYEIAINKAKVKYLHMPCNHGLEQKRYACLLDSKITGLPFIFKTMTSMGTASQINCTQMNVHRKFGAYKYHNVTSNFSTT